MKKETKALPMARINTRIRIDQHKFIKAVAKKTMQTEGEIFRAIIDMAIKNKQCYVLLDSKKQ